MEIPIDEPMQVVKASSILDVAQLVLEQTTGRMLVVATTKAGDEVVLEPVIKKIHLRFPQLVFECQLSQVSEQTLVLIWDRYEMRFVRAKVLAQPIDSYAVL